MECDEMEGTPISRLPDHLLLEIGGWLRKRRDLHALSLTSRRFCDLFEKELYRLDTSETRYSKSLRRVAVTSDYVLVNKLTRFGCSLDASCDYIRPSGGNMTALVLAMRRNNFCMAAYLTAAGANVNKAPDDSNIPVFMALEKENGLDIFKMLITGGNADLTVLNEEGQGLLTKASSRGNYKAVRYLLSYPSRLKVKDTEKSTPFHQAVLKGDYDMLQLLLSSKYTSPDRADEHNTTPLELAGTMYRLHHVFALLDDSRVNRKVCDVDESSVVLKMLREGNYGMAFILLTHRNAVQPCAMVFPLACEMRHERIARIVLEMSRPGKEQACDWRNCAKRNGLVHLATMITDKFGLERE